MPNDISSSAEDWPEEHKTAYWEAFNPTAKTNRLLEEINAKLEILVQRWKERDAEEGT